MEYEKIEQTKARLAEVDIQLTKAEAQYAMIVEMMRAVLKLQEKYVQLDKVFNLRKEKKNYKLYLITLTKTPKNLQTNFLFIRIKYLTQSKKYLIISSFYVQQ